MVAPVYECTPCPPGQSSDPGSLSCSDGLPTDTEAAGSRASGKPRCAECCGIGEYRLFMNTASSYCELCPAGQFWRLPTYAPASATEDTQPVYDCQKCAAGKYQPKKGQDTCKNLPNTRGRAQRANKAAADSSTAGGTSSHGCVLRFAVRTKLALSSRVLAAPTPTVKMVVGWMAMATGLPTSQLHVTNSQNVWARDGNCRQNDCSAAFAVHGLVADSPSALGIAELFEMGHFDALLARNTPQIRFESSATETAALKKTVSCASTAPASPAGAILKKEIVAGVAALALIVALAVDRNASPNGYKKLPNSGSKTGGRQIQM